MGAENEEKTKQSFADWQAAYVRQTQKAPDPIDNSSPAANLVFALRALLHPALRPFLFDPTLRIEETYPSLDEYARSLLESTGQAALAQLGGDDTAALFEAGLINAPAFAGTPVGSDTASVGAIWGSLYLPAKQAAAPCRVRAAWADAPRAGDGAAPRATASGWPAPRALRPVSQELEKAGRIALAAALAALRQSPAGLPDALRPASIVWDVCLPGQPDTLAQNAQGNSLQLPLALAFMSLLTGTALFAHRAATGALAPSDPAGASDCGVAVRPVGFLAEKERALAFLKPSLHFFVPAEPSESGVLALSETQIPVRGLAEAFARIVQTGETAGRTFPFAHSPRAQGKPQRQKQWCVLCSSRAKTPFKKSAKH